MNARELKQLQSQLTKIESELNRAKEEVLIAQQKVSLHSKQVKSLKKKIQDLSSRELSVTEHALLRYCQRIEGIDIDSVEEALLEQLPDFDGKFPIGDGFRAVIKDKKVITIIGGE